MIDARIVRTRAALDRAVSELAASIPISDITVSQLAEAASINRVTFYKHFETPSDALASALAGDLRACEQQGKVGDPPEDAEPIDVFRSAIDAALVHMDRFDAVYRTQLSGKHDGVVHPLLTEYFADVIASTSDTAPSDAADARRQLAVTFIAHGIAGSIAAWWQDLGMSREDLIDTVLLRLPDDLYQLRA